MDGETVFAETVNLILLFILSSIFTAFLVSFVTNPLYSYLSETLNGLPTGYRVLIIMFIILGIASLYVYLSKTQLIKKTIQVTIG